VVALPAPELLPEVRQAYQAGLMNPGFARLEEIERESQSQEPWRREKYTLITDAIAEMEWWAAFNKAGERPVKIGFIREVLVWPWISHIRPTLWKAAPGAALRG
jgi:hypothetical protein